MKKVVIYFFYLFLTGLLMYPLPSIAQDTSEKITKTGTSEEKDLGEWWLRNPLTYEQIPEKFLYHLEALYEFNLITGNRIDENHSLSTLITLRKKKYTYNIRYAFDKMDLSKRDEPPNQDQDVELKKSTKHELHNDFRVALTDHIIFAPGMFWLKDDYSQIKDRRTYYAGFGYSLRIKPMLLMTFFGAYGYEELDYIDEYHEIYQLLEDWENEDKAEDYESGTKKSQIAYLYQDIRLYLTRSVALTESCKFFRDLDDGDKYRWNFAVGADIKMTKHVLFRISYNEDYDNAPESIMGLKKRDTSLSMGLKLSF